MDFLIWGECTLMVERRAPLITSAGWWVLSLHRQSLCGAIRLQAAEPQILGWDYVCGVSSSFPPERPAAPPLSLLLPRMQHLSRQPSQTIACFTVTFLSSLLLLGCYLSCHVFTSSCDLHLPAIVLEDCCSGSSPREDSLLLPWFMHCLIFTPSQAGAATDRDLL